MKMIPRLLVFGLLSMSSTWASELSQSLNLKKGQVGLIAAEQGGGWSQSGVIKYTPRHQLNKNFSWGVDLGFSYFHRHDKVEFPVFKYLLSLDYSVYESLILRAKAGAETWGEDQGTKPSVGGEVARKLSEGLFGIKWVDEVFFSYQSVFQDPSSQQFVLGLGTQF